MDTESLEAGWTLDASETALTRTFRFTDFAEAFAFVTRIALHAEKVDHHPDIAISWNRVELRLTSHDVGGVTDRDRTLSRAIDRIAEAMPGNAA